MEEQGSSAGEEGAVPGCPVTLPRVLWQVDEQLAVGEVARAM